MYDKIARRYGITPVSIAATETYEAMQRGVVEGCIFNFPSIRSYRLNEQIKYITNGMRCGGYPGAVIINEKKWEKLPAEIQKGIILASEDAHKRWGLYWDEQHDETVKQFAKQGIEIYHNPSRRESQVGRPPERGGRRIHHRSGEEKSSREESLQ